MMYDYFFLWDSHHVRISQSSVPNTNDEHISMRSILQCMVTWTQTVTIRLGSSLACQFTPMMLLGGGD
jgi:hypothetical protein